MQHRCCGLEQALSLLARPGPPRGFPGRPRAGLAFPTLHQSVGRLKIRKERASLPDGLPWQNKAAGTLCAGPNPGRPAVACGKGHTGQGGAAGGAGLAEFAP